MKPKNIKIAALCALTLVLCAALCGCSASRYRRAEKLYEAGAYEEAAAIYEALGDYRHADEHLQECLDALEQQTDQAVYDAAMQIYAAGDYLAAAEKLTDIRSFSDVNAILSDIAEKIASEQDIDAAWSLYETCGERGAIARLSVPLSVGTGCVAAFDADGKALTADVAGGATLDASALNRVAQVACGSNFAVFRVANGQLFAFGLENSSIASRAEAVAGWENVVYVDCGGVDAIVAVHEDGTVSAVDGYTHSLLNIDFSNWSDVVQAACGKAFYVGMTRDGYVCTTGQNDYGQLDIELWGDLIAIDAGTSHTVALKSDGTVSAAGQNDDGQCRVGTWSDIVMISAAGNRTVGLKGDGTVICAGDLSDEEGQVISTWQNIRFVVASASAVYAIDADGRVYCSNGLITADMAAWALY